MYHEWIDISIPLKDGMMRWPGDPEVEIERCADLGEGDACNVTRLSMSTHVGTHVDAPLHYLEGGKSVDDLPIDATVGPARVVEIRHPQVVTERELMAWHLNPRERVLLKTRNSERRVWKGDKFITDYVHLTVAAAQYLARLDLRCVGIDALSVGGMEDGEEVHQILLQAGVCIVEGLDLRRVEPGSYELFCLPLRIPGAEGAPARAVLRPVEDIFGHEQHAEDIENIEDALEIATSEG